MFGANAVRLFVIRITEHYWPDFSETWRIGVAWAKEEPT